MVDLPIDKLAAADNLASSTSKSFPISVIAGFCQVRQFPCPFGRFALRWNSSKRAVHRRRSPSSRELSLTVLLAKKETLAYEGGEDESRCVVWDCDAGRNRWALAAGQREGSRGWLRLPRMLWRLGMRRGRLLRIVQSLRRASLQRIVQSLWWPSSPLRRTVQSPQSLLRRAGLLQSMPADGLLQSVPARSVRLRWCSSGRRVDGRRTHAGARRTRSPAG